MSEYDISKIPDSVIESLARATLSAMRRQDAERLNRLKASGSEKNADNENQNSPAQRENKTEK